MILIVLLGFFLQGQFKKRIESLEALLAEEREKVQSIAKKYEKVDGLRAKFEEEGKMFKKERDIAKQEVRKQIQ